MLTVSDQFDDYAQKLVNELRESFVRAEMGSSSDTMSKKIREGTVQKIPNLLVIGERERDSGQVTLRRYGVRQQVTLPFAEFKQALLATIANRDLEFSLED